MKLEKRRLLTELTCDEDDREKCDARLFSHWSDRGKRWRMLSECRKSQCTCGEDDCSYCEKCVVQLLQDLSFHLPTPGEMRRLGIELGIHPDVITACRENNINDINDAVFDMLYHHWYKAQGGLRRKSSVLEELGRAIVCVDKPQVWETIIRKYKYVA